MAENFEGQIVEAVNELVRWTLAGLQLLVLGAILALVAIVVGKIAQRIVSAVCRRLGLDSWADRLGLAETLGRIGLRSLSDLLARATFFIVLVFVGQIVADALGLTQISGLLGRVLSYVPRVLVAGAILLLGSAAAGYGRGVVVRTARESGIEYATALGTLFFGAVIFVLALMAINQLQIDTEAIWWAVGWGLAGLALGLGLAFGLGARTIVKNVLAGFYARQIFSVGKEVEFGQERGVLMSITPTNALFEHGDHIISVSNSALIHHVVKQQK